MRLLFVTACLCLMVFSGLTATDPRLLLEQFSGDAASSTIAIPDDVSVVVAIPSDRPIEVPAQLSIQPILQPQSIPLPPIRKPVVYRSRQEVCDTLIEAAQSNDLPVPFFIHLLFQESGFQPELVSSAGAEGVAQFMPETSASVGLDNPFDPLEAIPASARLLRSLFQRFGNLGLTAAAYNAGPRRIQDWLAKKGKLPQETQGYVKTITGRPAENWTVAEAGTPEMKLPRDAPCQEAAGLHAWNGPDHIPMPLPAPRVVMPSATKPGKGVIQLAARQSAAKSVAKPATKPVRLAIATHATQK